jgi:hypothetical protein
MGLRCSSFNRKEQVRVEERRGSNTRYSRENRNYIDEESHEGQGESDRKHDEQAIPGFYERMTVAMPPPNLTRGIRLSRPTFSNHGVS